MEHLQRRTGTFILATLFLCASFAFLPNHASALTVSPVRIEVAADPGTTANGKITLINDTAEEKTYYSSAQNFEAGGETGVPSFVSVNEGLSTWIKAPEKVVLSPGEVKEIPFSITIPKNAEPGGNFAALFWSTFPANVKDSGQVSLGAKIGILILLSVNGDVHEAGGIATFDAKNPQKFYTSLPITFFYRFRNDGADRVKPEGTLTIKNMFGGISEILPANTVEGNILPKSVRRFEIAWGEGDQVKGYFAEAKAQLKHFRIGKYIATLHITYGEKNNTSEKTMAVYIFPWQLLSLLLIVFTIIFGGGGKILKSYNAWIIAQAEKQFREREIEEPDEDAKPLKKTTQSKTKVHRKM